MSRVVLTEHKCRTLKPGERRRIVPDALCPGLILQVKVTARSCCERAIPTVATPCVG
jgi:hypothetical protein